MALRPALVYLAFNVLGFGCLFATIAAYEHTSGAWPMLLATAAGFIGLVLGQLLAIARVRTMVVVVGMALATVTAIIVASTVSFSGIPEELVLGMFCFAVALPCGFISLQHRWELLATFWPSIGFIGSVFGILNEEGRVRAWEEDKIRAWLPVPLAILFVFLVVWLTYLASKQALRVELWQSLSGSFTRRVRKKPTLGALPRRNLLPLLAAAVLLFAITAALAPFLWRTGKGDRPSKHPQDTQVEEEPKPKRPISGDGLVQQLKQMAEAAKDAAVNLWPLLLLLLFYRPAKRALLGTHLRRPLVPTPPTERIENAWEYVRIAAEDAGIEPRPTDSIEQLMQRIAAAGLPTTSAAEAAAIYTRTRYGFTVARGDADAMRSAATRAGIELRSGLGRWQRLRNLWRPLS